MPPGFLFVDTPFEINRLMLVRFIAVAILILLFWAGTRRMRMIPGRGQSILEMAVGFVQSNIADGALGKEEGKRFMPLRW